jgi:pimeloyl-ACP methyl ester carboxylesterase
MEVLANGTRIHYQVSGQDGPWVVLSHSLACELSMWDEQVRLLEGRYRVLRYDTRGHGGSEPPTGACTLEQLAADALGLMDAVGVARAHFVGLSMGGMIAQSAALAQPERFLSLVLADTTSRYPAEFAAVWEARIKLAREGGMEAHVAPTMQRWFTPGFAERASQRAFGERPWPATSAARRPSRRSTPSRASARSAARCWSSSANRTRPRRCPWPATSTRPYPGRAWW